MKYKYIDIIEGGRNMSNIFVLFLILKKFKFGLNVLFWFFLMVGMRLLVFCSFIVFLIYVFYFIFYI